MLQFKKKIKVPIGLIAKKINPKQTKYLKNELNIL